MNERDDIKRPDEPMSAESQQALAALARLPLPEAPAGARERARRAFLSGVDPAQETAPATPRGAVKVPPRSRSWSQRVWPLAAVIAAAAIGLLWYGHQPVSRWVVTDVAAPDGVTLPAPGSVIAAGTLTTPADTEFEFQLGETLRLRMRPSSRITLPPPPGRWFGHDRTLRVAAGEIYGTTGGQPLGFTMHLETAEGSGTITGTTFAVMCVPGGSCFCLWDGAVNVTPRSGDDPVEIPTDRKLMLFSDGSAPQVMPIGPDERMKLQMMHDSGIVRAPGGDQ